MVLTETAAQRYFGENEPIGQIVTVPSGQYEGTYQVTGVLKARI